MFATGIGINRYRGFRWWKLGRLVVGRLAPTGKLEISW